MAKKSESLTKSNYFLQPGYIYLPSKGTDISAVLGSCVSVCIYDKKRKTGGMNNFKLPCMKNKQKATVVYGNVSTYALINMLTNDGSEIEDLEAQIFGGAFNPEISPEDVGKDNFIAAKRILKQKQVRIVSEDAGGEKGRKIVFNTASGEVAVLRVETIRKDDWYPFEANR